MKLNWNDLSKYRNQLYGISMLWIIVFHVWETFQKKMSFNWTLSFIVKNGNIGVDLFLFLSGISMYYAIQKYVKEDGHIRLLEFYKKRISKILKVYVMFCVPYFVLKYFVLSYDFHMFMQQLLFQRKSVSSFWFLLGICVCYMLYPILYRWMSNGKKRRIYIFLIVYVIGLFLMCTFVNKYYMRYEILFSRIPVFVVGSLCGEKVFQKKDVSLQWLWAVPAFLLSKGPVFFLLKQVPFLATYERIFKRLHGGLLGISAVFFLIMLLKYVEETKLFRLLGFMGTFTLEVYVFHIAYRVILLEHLKISVVSYTEVFIFMILYTVSSFVFGYYLSKVLNRFQIGRKREENSMAKKVKKVLGYIKKNGIEGIACVAYVKMRQKFGGMVPLVSIVMPVYNVETYLPQALDSLLCQTMKHFEIIAVDDGSTDRSLEILKEYAKKDCRIKVLTQKNQYAGVARNTGLEKARGEYVLFLDSDDFFEKNLLKDSYYKAKLNKADLLIYGGRKYNESTKKFSKYEGLLRDKEVPSRQPFNYKDCPNNIYQMTTACPWTKMYRREFVEKTGLKFQALQNTNDVFFVSSSIAMAERIVTLNKILVNYRVGQKNNLQSSKKRYFYEALSAWHDKLVELGCFEELRQSYVNCALAGCIHNLRALKDKDLETKREVFYKLKDIAFDSLEIYGYDKDFYYNQEHYQKMQLVKNSTFEEYLETVAF